MIVRLINVLTIQSCNHTKDFKCEARSTPCWCGLVRRSSNLPGVPIIILPLSKHQEHQQNIGQHTLLCSIKHSSIAHWKYNLPEAYTVEPTTTQTL